MSQNNADLFKIYDKSKMRDAILGFSNQINDSFSIISKLKLNKEYSNINQILILGMGGSAIGGDVVKVMVQNECSVPIMVNRSYKIPQWVNSNTLILASSYSGDTEETLSAFGQCKVKKCPIIVLSTGGKIAEYANKYGLDVICIPKGHQPRSALGFSFSLILLLLNHLGFVCNEIINKVKNSITLLETMSSELINYENSAFKIAENIHMTCPIIYGSEDLTWVAALRFRAQLAENAKMLSFHNHFPEQNHNEIEGWTANPNIIKNFSIIWIKDLDDHPAIKMSMEITSKLLERCTFTQLTISQIGRNRIERLLKMLHFIDWISYYAALLNKIDPTPVHHIQELKRLIKQSG